MNDLVSVIIPTYNRSRCLGTAIESVLSQTYTNLELIVVDDCSTDNTRDLVSSYQDDRLRYIRLEKNAGACFARNKGVELSRGEYIAFQDSDDEWHTNKLEEQMKIFDKENVDVVICKLLVDNTFQMPEWLKEGCLNQKSNMFEIGTQTIVARKEVLKDISFDDKLPRFQEFEWLLRVSNQYVIYCVDKGLVDYNISEDSIGKNNQKLYDAVSRINATHTDFKRRHPASAQELSNFVLRVACKLDKESKPSKNELIALAWDTCPSMETGARVVLVKLGIFEAISQLRKNVQKKGIYND